MYNASVPLLIRILLQNVCQTLCSGPSAICSPAPYMKSIGPKSVVNSLSQKAVPITGVVTSHTVQTPHIDSTVTLLCQIPIHDLSDLFMIPVTCS